MSVLSSLFDEHRLILRVTDAFERYLNRLPADAPEARHDLHRFVTFFREYTDLVHHEKEEAILLPAMVRAGCDWESPDFELIRKDHQQERYLMRVMRQAAAQRGTWTGEELRHLKSVGMELVAFMRTHIDRENAKLYPSAIEHIRGAHEAALELALADFDRVRREHGDDGWLLALADELVRDYHAETAA